MVVSTKQKLSQNIQALIGEIGEKQVLLRLSILVQQTAWGVFHNLGEAGYDILLLNSKTQERIRIEVKTRQKIHTTGKNFRQVQFFLTDGEYHSCDFLIAYFLDKNVFYIIPKEDLRRTNVSDRTRWRFTLTLNTKREPHKNMDKYLNAWSRINSDFYKDPIIGA